MSGGAAGAVCRAVGGFGVMLLQWSLMRAAGRAAWERVQQDCRKEEDWEMRPMEQHHCWEGPELPWEQESLSRSHCTEPQAVLCVALPCVHALNSCYWWADFSPWPFSLSCSAGLVPLHSMKSLPAVMFPLPCISSGRCLSLRTQQVTGFLWSANSAASLSILTQLMHKPNPSVLGLSKALSYTMPKLQTDRPVRLPPAIGESLTTTTSLSCPFHGLLLLYSFPILSAAASLLLGHQELCQSIKWVGSQIYQTLSKGLAQPHTHFTALPSL